MNPEILSIPLELKKIIEGYFLLENTTGCSQSKVYKLEHQTLPSLYLKVLPANNSEKLNNEYLKLEWLKFILPVPMVKYFYQDIESEYLLLSEIAGLDSSKYLDRISNNDLVKLLAGGLKYIHSVNINNCSFKETIKEKMTKAYYNVAHNLVDENDFDEINIGKTSKQLYLELLKSVPFDEELVFTHGDYCLPNIIINDNKINGFIDLGRSGIADKYQDLALAVRSIEYNFGNDYSDLFFEYYGLKKADKNKIRFYQLLDEFF